MKKYRFEILLAVFYLLLALLVTYPLIFDFRSSIYSIPERTVDSFASIYRFWWAKEAHAHGYSATLASLLGPKGVELVDFPLYMIATRGLGERLATVSNEVFAYNFLMLTSFVWSALSMYLLAFYVTKNRWAAVLAGFIYAFSPLHRRYAFEWLDHAQWQWLPLYVLALLKLDQVKSLGWGVMSGLLFTLVSVEDYYFGYFAAFFTFGFVLFRIAQSWFLKRRFYFDHKRSASYLLAAGVFLVLTLPVSRLFLEESQRLAAGREGTIGGFVHDEWPRFAFSARPWFYVLPDVHHPLFGEYAKRFYDWLATKPPYFITKPFYPREHTLYLGLTTIFLSAIAVFEVLRSKRFENWDLEIENCIWLFLFLGIMMMIFSAPPYATVSLHKIYFPSYFLYRLFPMFRSYARFGVLVLLCFSILAAFGFKILLEKTKSRRGRILMTIFALCVLNFEFLDIPPFHTVSLKPLPVYRWLAEQPGDFAILVYPPDLSNRDLLAQRIHRKRFLNPKAGTPPEVREVLENIDRAESPAKLKNWNVKYLVVRDPQEEADYWKDLGFADFADLVSALALEENFELVKTYNDPSVYLYAVP